MRGGETLGGGAGRRGAGAPGCARGAAVTARKCEWGGALRGSANGGVAWRRAANGGCAEAGPRVSVGATLGSGAVFGRRRALSGGGAFFGHRGRGFAREVESCSGIGRGLVLGAGFCGLGRGLAPGAGPVIGDYLGCSPGKRASKQPRLGLREWSGERGRRWAHREEDAVEGRARCPDSWTRSPHGQSTWSIAPRPLPLSLSCHPRRLSLHGEGYVMT